MGKKIKKEALDAEEGRKEPLDARHSVIIRPDQYPGFIEKQIRARVHFYDHVKHLGWRFKLLEWVCSSERLIAAFILQEEREQDGKTQRLYSVFVLQKITIQSIHAFRFPIHGLRIDDQGEVSVQNASRKLVKIL